MKTTFCIIVASLLSLTISAEVTNTGKRTRPPRRPYTPSGGIVEKKYTGNVLRIINTQDIISADKVQQIAQEMRWQALLPFEVMTKNMLAGESPMKIATDSVNVNNVGAIVLVINEETLPIVLTAPEQRWTILNINSIKTDAKSIEKIEERFTKLLWIAIGRTLGAGYSSYKPCVMAPFKDIVGLDNNPAKKPCPEPFNKMIDTGAAYGIKTINIASYRKACQEGWAPAPTNDIQKAIWDKVHAMPTAPIKIKPETKKVRE